MIKLNFLLLIAFLLPFFGYGSHITVVTMAVGDAYQKKVSLGIKTKEDYCKQWGYDIVCGTDYLDPSRPIPWSKILLLINLMETSSSEWFFWTDADSMVTNLAIPLEDFIDEDYELIVTRDFNDINTGQFFIRNCRKSLNFLKKVYAHTDCIFHHLWENEAIKREINTSHMVKRMTKILPQRLFNSYPPEVCGNTIQHTFQPGDFLLHFASIRDGLEGFFKKYSEHVLNDKRAISIDSYLNIYGFSLSPTHSNRNEGYMTESQKSQFKETLATYPEIKSIAEIGLNGGHSLALFLSSTPHIEKVVSFDLNQHDYTKVAVEYFSRFYKEQFTFVEGDSKITVPTYTATHPGSTFDLIYIDGDHSYEGCLTDIINCQYLAGEGSRLWIDDYNGVEIQNAVQTCVNSGLLKVLEKHVSENPCGHREWIEARYMR